MDSSIDLSASFADSGIEHALASLDEDLVGLSPVKTKIKEIAALLLVDQARKKLSLSSTTPGLHMSFTGHPGTGKTTVARRISQVLHRLGYLSRGHIVTATRDDLVGQYVGHTAPKTREMIKRAKGGVLFIDEAYYLYKPGNERDFGAESIEILLQSMELKSIEFVVIFAGYREQMNDFYKCNPGLSSRVSHHIDFPDYSNDELMRIALLLLDQQNYFFSDEAHSSFEEYIERRRELPFFANARSIRNALDRARLRQANRLFSRMGELLTKEDLMTIESADVLASRVFKGEIERDVRLPQLEES
ncbi:CbbX protein [Prochlorococcus sp. MIT 1341]|uniref:CbbX protein n=1 Tax=Prochlorococcus sp. MIT 1341 TaxID=3096221 RepID=UPI002A74C0E5|nr:CbbX protein [Prochlorococcus sp. MIT 1341]